ncbi:MAG TPA: S26 family signal peptidase [Patescibacteria group bacterium]|jgi:signal peptidase I|nr:S26 family signal peptidase [Patescibacteria group bacterium]
MLLFAKLKVIGHSMEPAIRNGETVLASNIFYWFKKPRINDIVAFRSAGGISIKRITKINQEKYFLAGDNQQDSLDSRKFGLISRQKILGKVIYKV